MSWITSRRERRLWLWTLAVMAAIYSTLGPARTVVDALRERNLLRHSFTILVILVLIAVAWHWTRKRPGWREVGVGLGVGLAYWMTLVRIENPAERTHLFEYGVVAALVHMALLERARNGRPIRAPAALTVAITAALGLLDECIQAVLPSRVFDWKDVMFNALAGFMVIVARLAMAPVRGPGWRLWFLWSLAGAVGWGWSMDPGTFGLGQRFEILPSLPTVDLPNLVSLAAGSMIIAVLQAVLLRRYAVPSLRWLLASAAGGVVAASTVWAGGLVDADLAWIAGVGLYGTAAGALQWLVLRQCSARAGWWVFASTIGWLVAIPLGDLVGPPGWALFGATTGTALVWLLRGPRPPASGDLSTPPGGRA